MRGGDGKWFCAMCGNGDGEGKKIYIRGGEKNLHTGRRKKFTYGEGKKIYIRGGDGNENHLPCNALVTTFLKVK